MKEIRNIVLIASVTLIYVFNFPVINYFYPAKTNFNEFYYLRDQAYEAMFLLSFVLFYFNTNRLTKAFASFGLVLIAGSFIDKVLFGIRDYVITDILLVVLAFYVLIVIYKKNRHA